MPSSKTDGAVFAAMRALAPWSFTGDSPGVSARAAAALAGIHIVIAAGLSVVLSTWTYLIGKGLLMTAAEMDMGMDDLPADSVGQVATGFVGAFGVWVGLLVLAVGIAAAVADLLYRSDRQSFRVALRRAAAATIWFVVWAAGVLVVNSVLHGELRHPAAAVRAYAQHNQHWFSGSSAFDPGPIAPQALAARGRLKGLALLFPLMWSLSMPAPGGARSGRVRWCASAFALSLLAWWAVWRLLPWIALETLAG